jgi:hypothetical protein
MLSELSFHFLFITELASIHFSETKSWTRTSSSSSSKSKYFSSFSAAANKSCAAGHFDERARNWRFCCCHKKEREDKLSPIFGGSSALSL